MAEPAETTETRLIFATGWIETPAGRFFVNVPVAEAGEPETEEESEADA